MRQAVIVFHGMGEQVPMQTVRTFVDTVWRSDSALIDPDRPDADTGKKRTQNKAWTKPDDRTGSFETRRITTERAENGYYTDFFEFYWAHMVHGTTFEQVRSWVMDLLLRNPLRRVPRAVFLAWCALWCVTIGVVAFGVWAALPKAAGTAPIGPVGSLILTGVSLGSAWFVSNVLVRRFGDVVRYTKADPPNIARRQEIREAGVAFLEKLLLQKGKWGRPEYDRIIVVAHSLGTIVAYDILAETFARLSETYDKSTDDALRHPARNALEREIRQALGLEPRPEGQPELTPERYQELQDGARAELTAFGCPWRVSDFVTLGSPLTHAEFIMAEDMEDLRALQRERAMPTCPPIMEYDRGTGQDHFTFRRGSVAKIGVLDDAELQQDPQAETALPRRPHHAALFAYTRWSNLYSQHKAILTGDIVSGPLAGQFGLRHDQGGFFSGIREVAVLPELNGDTGKAAQNHRRRFVSHNAYWSQKGGTDIAVEKDPETGEPLAPHHIRTLRDALGLGRK